MEAQAAVNFNDGTATLTIGDVTIRGVCLWSAIDDLAQIDEKLAGVGRERYAPARAAAVQELAQAKFGVSLTKHQALFFYELVERLIAGLKKNQADAISSVLESCGFTASTREAGPLPICDDLTLQSGPSGPGSASNPAPLPR